MRPFCLFVILCASCLLFAPQIVAADTTYGQFGNGTHNANPAIDDRTADHLFELVSDAGGDTGTAQQLIRITSYGAKNWGNNFHFYRAYGSESDPKALPAGAALFSFGARPHDGTGFVSSSAAFQAITTEDQSPGHRGVRFVFSTVATGTASPRPDRLVIGPGESPAVTVVGDLEVTGEVRAANVGRYNALVAGLAGFLGGLLAAAVARSAHRPTQLSPALRAAGAHCGRPGGAATGCARVGHGAMGESPGEG